MLVRLGCVHEAANYGQKYLRTTDEALALAKALYEQGECEQRLQMAEHGLTLQGYPWRSGCVSKQHRWEKMRVLVPLLNIHEIFAYFIEA